MSEKCFRCGKELPDRFTMTFGGPPGSMFDDLGWHWINPAPDASAVPFSTVGMVPVCNKCDPPPVLIPRARYEALMAAAKASAALEAVVRKDANPSGWFKAMAAMFEKLAALRAAGIQIEGE